MVRSSHPSYVYTHHISLAKYKLLTFISGIEKLAISLHSGLSRGREFGIHGNK